MLQLSSIQFDLLAVWMVPTLTCCTFEHYIDLWQYSGAVWAFIKIFFYCFWLAWKFYGGILEGVTSLSSYHNANKQASCKMPERQQMLWHKHQSFVFGCMSNFNGHLLFQADRLSCSYLNPPGGTNFTLPVLILSLSGRRSNHSYGRFIH